MLAALAISGRSAVAQTERGVEPARLIRGERAAPNGWTALPEAEFRDLLESLRREMNAAYARLCASLTRGGLLA